MNRLGFYKVVFVVMLSWALPKNLIAQNQVSNSGREFWVGYATNLTINQSDLRLYITSEVNTQATVTTAFWTRTFNITADSTTEIVLDADTFSTRENTNPQNRGIRITSNQDITVFASNVQDKTTDATVVLPKVSIGTGSEYIINRYLPPTNNTYDRNYVIFVGMEDSTEILVSNPPAGYPSTIWLSRFQTFGMPYRNTNATISAKSGRDCKPFVIYFANPGTILPTRLSGWFNTGNTANGHPLNTADHLFTQVIPISKWGNSYTAMPFWFHTAGYLLSIIAQENNTAVSINGAAPFNLNRGQRQEVNVNTQVITCISGNKPIAVMQFMKTQGHHGAGNYIGDASVVDLNANSQTVPRATFSSPTGGLIDKHFVNILIDSSHRNLLYIDSTKANSSKFMNTTACGRYLVYRDSVKAGTHTIICDSGFVAYAYGQTIRESYIFSIGASYENQVYNFNFVAPKRCPGDTIKVVKFGDTVKSVKFIYGNRVDSGQIASYVFNRPGVYEVKMVVQPFAFECADTITKTIEIGGPKRVFPNDTTYCRDFKQVIKLDTSSLDSFAWNIPDYYKDTLLINRMGVYAVYLLDTFGCAYTDTFRVNQFNAPFADVMYSPNNCSADSIAFINRSNDTGVVTNMRYYLKFGSNEFVFVDSIKKVFLPDTGVKNGLFVAEKGGFCRDTVAVQFNVRPHPFASFEFDTISYCFSQNLFDFKNTSDSFSYPLSYKWMFDNNDSSTSLNVQKSFVRVGQIPISLVATNNFGCKSEKRDTITVFPSPVTSFTINDTLQCLRGNSFDFTSSTNYSGVGSVAVKKWFVSNTQIGTGNTVTNYTFNSPGEFVITLIDSSTAGCLDTFSRKVYVKPHPVAQHWSSSYSSCLKGNNIEIKDTTQHNSGIASISWSISNPVFDKSGKTFTPVFSSAGTYVFKQKVVDGFGCDDSTFGQITIFPQAELKITSDTACAKDSLQTIFISSVDTGRVTNYSWLVDTSLQSNDSIFRFRMETAGSYDVTLFSETNFGCKDTLTQNASVLIRPLPTVLISSNSPVCESELLQLSNNTVDTGQHANMDYYLDWYGSQRFVNNKNFQLATSDTGVQQVNFFGINQFGCRDSVMLDYRVIPDPVASFTFSDIAQCFRGNNFKPQNSSLGFNYNLNHTWYFGNGDSSTSFEPNYSYSGFDTFDIRLKVSNAFGCSDDSLVSNYLIVHPNPEASFLVNDSLQCFRFHSFDFTSTADVATGSIQKYYWDFSDNKTDSTATVNGLQFTSDDSTYRVTHIVTSALNCLDTFVSHITTKPQPIAQFWSDSLGQCLKGNQFELKDTGQYTNQIVEFVWEIATLAAADSGRVFNFSFPYADTFGFLFRVKDIFGCTDSVSGEIEIYPQADLSFFTDTACLRDSISLVSYSSVSIGNITSQTWNLGNSQAGSGEEFTYLYPSTGTYDITLHTETDKNCKDTLTQNASVLIRPLPAPLISSISPICENFNLEITNNTIDTGQHAGADYYLDWYGNQQLENTKTFQRLPQDTGVQQMNFFAINQFGCRDSTTLDFRIIPEPKADFFFPYRLQCLRGNIFEPENRTDTFGYSADYFWDFGIRTFDIENPSISFPDTGSYPMFMRVVNSFGCTQTIYDTLAIDLFPIPTINYTLDLDSQCLFGNSFVFTNQSAISDGTFETRVGFSGVDSVFFGDTLAYQIPRAGLFHIDIFINSDLQCKDTVSAEIRVWEMPEAEFLVNAPTGCEGQSTFGFNNQTIEQPANLEYVWRFDNQSNLDSVQNFTHVFQNEGTYDVELEAITEQNCRDTAREILIINPVPKPTALSNSDGQCFNNQVYDFYSNTQLSNGAYESYWTIPEFGEQNADSLFDLQFTSVGFKDIKYKAVSDSGCADSMSFVIEVFASPQASFVLDTNASCLKYNQIIAKNTSSVSAGTLTQNWYKDDFDLIGTENNLAYSFADSGWYWVRLEAKSEEGCADTVSQQVRLYLEPFSQFSATLPDSCFYDHELFVNSSAFGFNGTIRSDFALSDLTDLPNTENFSHIFQDFDTFFVQQIVTDEMGCADTTTQQVIVRPQPLARISTDIIQPCLRVNQFDFKDSTLANGVTYNRTWDMVDEAYQSTDSIVKYTYSLEGNKSIYLTTEGPFGCSSKDSAYVVVLPKNELDYLLSDNSYCFNEQELSFEYEGAVPFVDLDGLWWEFGDGTIDSVEMGSKNYADTGLFSVKLISLNIEGCYDTLDFTVEIKPNPIADFGLNDTIWCLGNQAITFTSTSIAQKGSIAQWEWDFDDGETSADSFVKDKTFAASGEYTIRHVVMSDNNCFDTTYKPIALFDNPVASFASDTFRACLRGNSFTMNSTTQFFQGIEQQYWYFPSENEVDSGTSFTFSSSNPGEFGFTLISKDILGCSDTVSGLVTVHPQANIDFIADTVCLKETSYLASLSTIDSGSLVDYFWNLGDGNSATGQQINHLFNAPKAYTIQLITESNFGCFDTLTKPGISLVRSLPVADFTFEKTYDSLTTTGYQFSDMSSGNGPYLYDWTFDRFGFSQQQNPYNEFSDTGVMTTTLLIIDIYGCQHDTSKSFLTYPANQIWVPNAFSPNENRLNETFGPVGISYARNYEMSIYNRWGELIFTTKNLNENWDGTYKGEAVQPGVYVYKIKFINLQDKLVTRSGSVTLLR